MKMFMVSGKEDGFPPVSYYRTYEEAEQAITGRVLHSRGPDRTGFEWLKITEVERDSHPCCLCGAESTARDPVRYPYCQTCHYTGAAEEDLREGQMDFFRTQLPEAGVGIEHTGGGCMWLAFRFPNRPGREYLIATNGDAALPCEIDENGERQAIRGGWGYFGVQLECVDSCSRETPAQPCCGDGGGEQVIHYAEYDGEGIDARRLEEDLLTDQQVVELVKTWLAGGGAGATLTL